MKRQVESLPSAILSAIGEAVVVVGPTGEIVFANGPAEDLLGFGLSELEGLEVEILIPGGLGEEHRKHRRRYSENPLPRHIGSGRELVARRKDGSELPVEIALGPILVAGDFHVVCVLHDLSELRTREAYLQEVVDAMPGVFYLFDSEGRLVWWNRHFEKVFGYTGDELRGRGMFDFVHPKDHEELTRRVGLLYADGKTRTAEYDIVRKDGGTIPYCGNGALCEIDGEQHMVGLTMDVSQLRSTESELEERLVEIEELKHQLELENTYLRTEHAAHHPGDVIGESRAIRKVLDLVGGKISGPGGAAEILGLKPTTLRSRMGKLGISARR